MPLTILGLLCGAASGVAFFHYGQTEQDMVLRVVGCVGLVACGVGVLSVSLAGLWLWRHLRRASTSPALRMECGQLVPTGFAVRWPWWMAWLSLSLQWESPTVEVVLQTEGPRRIEQVRPLRRGKGGQVVRRLEIRDPLGLASLTIRHREERGYAFLPWMGGLRQLPIVWALAGGQDLAHPKGPPEGDRMDFRDYAAGDPVRYILWKVFAKTRELVVRTPERAIAPVRKVVAYLVAARGDEPAAGAARAAVESGALGNEWILGADGSDHVARGKADALELVTSSAQVGADLSGAGLENFLRSASVGAATAALVFVPPWPGPWLDRVLKTAKQSIQGGSTLRFAVCIDGLKHPPVGARWRQWLLRAEANGNAPSHALPAPAERVWEVVRSLRAIKSQVMLVDRSVGRVFDDQRLAIRLQAAA